MVDAMGIVRAGSWNGKHSRLNMTESGLFKHPLRAAASEKSREQSLTLGDVIFLLDERAHTFFVE